ncbi:acyloxyacyl hydrolase [Agrobacterium tumefaciens]|uniref:acyloxyacyl hydrolase n=1 Tax=Rhizobium/Agrobacterium group TaxID=227290 RepID=UPI00080FE142|nr:MULTISPECIES: acyloxyacyl hydrolase [Rhizobium/Agrobacterium group]MDH7805379.1 lipid A 3-O-deacylase [Rhizobium sp. AN67]MDQ4406915.1 acyloxyacyl hydrolase [Rhizobium sp. AN63]MQB05947.1 acyloxyacyl hydrolase [Agrobacterium tumefaciens]NSY48635.1 acyloxyacyl hydrolase [Agrobacterium tumefaciens]NSZ63131.1 acyloxyacyl hydrolase [Agrobacterium tumefaciens]
MAAFGSISARAFVALAMVFAACVLSDMTPAAAADGTVFDELRFGVTTSLADRNGGGEDGVFPAFTAYFDPFASASAVTFGEKLARPRLHLGAEIGTEGEANTIYGGINWTFDLNPKIFVDLGFGGLWHDGRLRNGPGETGAEFGCRVLFHEYAAIGYRFNSNWNISTQIEHASHANLCDGPNDGLTRVGLMVGYKF